MKMTRWRSAAALAIASLLLAACAGAPAAPDATARQALAPTGKLRVAVYQGSPTSFVRNAATGETKGVALDLGRAMAARLGVPFELVEFAKNPDVLAAVKEGRADFAFTNATAARAQFMDFSPPVLGVEQGYLAAKGSTLANASEVDRPGVRVGVSQGSSSQKELAHLLKAATIVAAPTLKAGGQMLAEGKLDAFATNKAILHELSAGVPGSRVLDGRYGLESFAVGVPKGREAGLAWLRDFVRDARADGTVARAVERAGLRGTTEP